MTVKELIMKISDAYDLNTEIKHLVMQLRVTNPNENDNDNDTCNIIYGKASECLLACGILANNTLKLGEDEDDEPSTNTVN